MGRSKQYGKARRQARAQERLAAALAQAEAEAAAARAQREAEEAAKAEEVRRAKEAERAKRAQERRTESEAEAAAQRKRSIAGMHRNEIPKEGPAEMISAEEFVQWLYDEHLRKLTVGAGIVRVGRRVSRKQAWFAVEKTDGTMSIAELRYTKRSSALLVLVYPYSLLVRSL